MLAHHERTFEINGLSIAAQCWGDSDARPTLALHGWADNSESFARISRHLPGRYIVAPDLAGNGHSDSRAAHASYNIWDDLLDIHCLSSALGWENFDLIGHSRGAIVSFLFTCAMPEKVNKMVALDGLLPFPDANLDAPGIDGHVNDGKYPKDGRRKGDASQNQEKYLCRSLFAAAILQDHVQEPRPNIVVLAKSFSHLISDFLRVNIIGQGQ